jgi:15-cis-phytoene synthase
MMTVAMSDKQRLNDRGARARTGGEERTAAADGTARGDRKTARAERIPSGDQSTFAPGLRALPRAIRPDVARLYTVLRTLDDLVDEDSPQAPARLEAVERWARGHPADSPETRTLTELAARYPLDAEKLLEFCAGMRHDVARASIADEDELERYCQRAGGSVGSMLAALLGTSGPEGVTRMATLGRAMQRTNILRDIDEDAEHGRHYIAAATIERFGAPLPGKRAELMRDQIERADALYEQGLPAIGMLAAGRTAMALSAALYREILRQIERDGYGRVPGRAIVPVWRRRVLIAEYRLRPHPGGPKMGRS